MFINSNVKNVNRPARIIFLATKIIRVSLTFFFFSLFISHFIIVSDIDSRVINIYDQNTPISQPVFSVFSMKSHSVLKKIRSNWLDEQITFNSKQIVRWFCYSMKIIFLYISTVYKFFYYDIIFHEYFKAHLLARLINRCVVSYSQN